MNILISKNNPKPSKFQNLNFGEITNQTIKEKSKQTIVFGCMGAISERAAEAPVTRRSSIGQRRGGVGASAVSPGKGF